MKTTRKGTRETIWLGTVCAAALLPLGYIVLKRRAANPPVLRGEAWKVSRFVPTAFSVGSINMNKDVIVMADSGAASSPLVFGTLSDARLVKTLRTSLPANNFISCVGLSEDLKRVSVIWGTDEAGAKTYVDRWDWRAGRRLSRTHFQFTHDHYMVFFDTQRIYCTGREKGNGNANTIAIFNIRTGRKIASRPFPPGENNDLDVTDDASRVALFSDDRVWICDGRNLKTMRPLTVSGTVVGVSWISNHRLAVHGTNRTTVYDVDSGRAVKHYLSEDNVGPSDSSRGVMTPTGVCERYIWTNNSKVCFGLQNGANAQGASEASLYVWKQGSKLPIATLKVPGTYDWLQIPDDDRYLVATGYNDKGTGIRIWNINELAHPKKHPPKKPKPPHP